MFDPSKLRHCSGLWSGTVTWERKYQDDGDIVKPNSHETIRQHVLTTSTWEIKPNVLAEAPCYNCESRMYDAVWRGSVSEDSSYVMEYGNCTDSTTVQGQVATTAPSAIFIEVAGDRRSFRVYRASPGSMGAPPEGLLSDEIDGTRVPCSGDESQAPHFVGVAENLVGWPYSGQWIPLERTDPTIPWTSAGQHVTRNEIPEVDGTKIVMTDTWSWKLTLEPDGGQ